MHHGEKPIAAIIVLVEVGVPYLRDGECAISAPSCSVFLVGPLGELRYVLIEWRSLAPTAERGNGFVGGELRLAFLQKSQT